MPAPIEKSWSHLANEIAGEWTDPAEIHARMQEPQPSLDIGAPGSRAQIADVERILSLHPAIGDAVASMLPGGAGQSEMIIWVVPRGTAPLTGSEILAYLRERMPLPRVGDVFLVESLPRTATGGLDEEALNVLSAERRGGEDSPFPQTPIEKRVAAIWAEILGFSEFSRDEGFLELGGHSLQAVQVLSLIRERFGIEVPITALFDQAITVRNLSEAIELAIVERAGLPGDGVATLRAMPDERIEQILLYVRGGADNGADGSSAHD